MKVAELFVGVAYKKLVLVDLPDKGSHQHELNGSRKLCKVLGHQRTKGQITWMRFTEKDQPTIETGEYTWYDAREKSSAQTGRTEWRLYYKGASLAFYRIGDILIIAKLKNGNTLGLLFVNPSKWLDKASELFGISIDQATTLQVLDQFKLSERDISSEEPFITLLEVNSLIPNDQPTNINYPPQTFTPPQIVERQSLQTGGAYKIRPAGRHILTIGRDLIQDPYAAVVELVKNAFDADSPDVTIEFKASPNRSRYTICIQDHGHGMSRDTVINKWMVPSTDDKLSRKTSPGGRTMQGRKGIGRYATSILGDDLLLETSTPSGEATTVYLEWKMFERAQYLDDVEILIETTRSAKESGTRLTIAGDIDSLSKWNARQFDKLRFELKKLKTQKHLK